MRGVAVYTVLATWIAFASSQALPNVIRIGGLFDSNDEEQEMAFRFAVDRINADTAILPRSTLVAQVEKIGKDDSFRATKKVCGLLGNSIAAIFGPMSDVTSMHVQSICDALEIPHVETRWDFQLQRDDLSLNLFPRPAVLSHAYVDLVRVWGWSSFSVVYEENEGIIRLQDFFKEANLNGWQVKLYQFKSGEPYRDLFWQIKRTGETKIVLDVKQESIFTVLRHAQQVGMMTESHSYLITSLDLHTIDLEDFKYGKTNITGFRLVDEGNEDLKRLLDEWETMSARMGKPMPPPHTLKTETALMYDAVKLFAEALQALDRSQAVEIHPISCVNGTPWSHGSSLINFMKSITFWGLTGEVKFDSQGFRSHFMLDLVHLTTEGLKEVGNWNPAVEELHKRMTVTMNETSEVISSLLQNKTLVVTTVLVRLKTKL